jgi:TonB family protein
MMKLKISLFILCLIGSSSLSNAQDYETCSFSEDAWSGDTAAITAFLISCGRIDTTNYDEQGKKTTGKPHHQSITMKLNNGKIIHNDSIYFVAEVMPSFQGGEENLMKHLKTNIHYPPQAQSSKTEGTVVVSFIIDRNGMPSNIKIVRGIGKGCDEEAMRVVKSMPKWNPGKLKGKPVRVQYNLPVKFKLT